LIGNMMLTVPEAAARSNPRPETIRRWIRSGRLRAQRVGAQNMIDERDLLALLETDDVPGVPEQLRTFPDGFPQPNWVALIREHRRDH
jgi:excisionase family DNA binding protein